MKLSIKTVTIWFMWIMAALFFAWAAYWAPTGSDGPTAPEAFLVLLGIAHLVAGAALIVGNFAEDNDW